MNTKDAPPAPHIPLLGRDNVIDLDVLGTDDLLTYVQYPGLAIGHGIEPNWRGRSPLGEAIDETNYQDVDDRLEHDENGHPRMPIVIENAKLIGLNQGEVFYSYRQSDGGPLGEESRRLFFYVGKRVGILSLPVAQMKESHALCVDPSAIAGPALISTAPYQAMAEGDELTFTWVAHRATGGTPTTHTIRRTLSADDVGKTLEWSLPKAQLTLIQNGGHGVMQYQVQYADPQDPLTPESTSAEQTITAVDTLEPLLPELIVAGADSGSIDPARHPDGLPVQVPLYDSRQPGDVVTVYAQGDTNLLATALLDVSAVESGIITLVLEHRWLQENNGKVVELLYHYARAGASFSSRPLTLMVRRPLELYAPNVDKANLYDDDGSGVVKGWVNAADVLTGAVIDIPQDSVIGNDDKVSMIWDGFGDPLVVTTPSIGNDRRFNIPRTAVPMNVGKHVLIHYEVLPPDEAVPHASPFYDLEIRNFDSGWPRIQAERPKLSGGSIKLSEITDPVMLFKLESWYFIAEGQLLKIQASGVSSATGQVVTNTMRDETQPLTDDEYYVGYILPALDKGFLDSLVMAEKLSVLVQLSYDQGSTYKKVDERLFLLAP
ncbi:hypothetical protein [Pseudomonas sp. NFACC46-3]|uniref:hypothetical protein n=1 Tax=Pseudomonas sp. NFACC46-3 TaxID=1566200 RepID=UPI0008E1800D|nr:hypothetical protein [Pseudomonas sp. NFACC46-3]SFL27712.1 hypothetical protein SAMN03159307_01617 [Pseudomonas sp. NFACC46-3]